jgi:hypothetical protein
MARAVQALKGRCRLRGHARDVTDAIAQAAEVPVRTALVVTVRRLSHCKRLVDKVSTAGVCCCSSY